jgi:DNA-binding response OmpR family regulator
MNIIMNSKTMTDETAKKPLILLAEDEQTLAKMYQTKFSMEGFDVAYAEDGNRALEILQTKRPDLILLDIIMPNLDGFGVLRKIKQDENLKTIPVVLLTNLGQETDIKQGIELGADDYLIKAHFTPQEVADKVKEILGKK